MLTMYNKLISDFFETDVVFMIVLLNMLSIAISPRAGEYISPDLKLSTVRLYWISENHMCHINKYRLGIRRCKLMYIIRIPMAKMHSLFF